jgi:capsular exopolysaccharide synthesis family protein
VEPVYAPVAKIEVAPPGSESFSLQNSGDRFDASAYSETQSKILQSDELAIATIRKLHLDRKRDFSGALVTTNKLDSPAASADNELPNLTPAERASLEVFRKSLKVTRDTSSWLIDVSFAAHDPESAAAITNGLVDEFIDQNYVARHQAIVQSTQWLARQLDDIRARMEKSNRVLADFQRSSGIAALGNTGNTFEETISELNRQLTAAQAERIQLQSIAVKLDVGNPDTIPQVNSDPVTQDLSRKLASTKADLKQALVIYGVNHPKVKALNAQISDLEAQLTSQQGSVLASLNRNYATARLREGLLNSRLKEVSKQLGLMSQYETLKKEAQVNEDLYNALYAKVKEAGISAESKSMNIRWVDRARVLQRPTRPRRLLDISVATLIGIFGGLLLAFVREGFDPRIHTLEDVRLATGLSSVTLIPTSGDAHTAFRGGRSKPAGENDHSPDVFLISRPGSAEAQALRQLYTSVQLSTRARAPQVLLVASALPGEGKTTLAVNMAVALSRSGSTCLINSDLRKPNAASVLGVEYRWGLAELLNKACSLEQAVVPVQNIPGLSLLAAGRAEAEPGEVVTTEAMSSLLRDLRRQFRFIVIDSAPVLPYAEPRAIAPLADGVIFIARSGLTTPQAVQRALEMLAEVHSAPVLEIVLNAVKLRSADYRYQYGY